ncbi:MAG: hypothetical protein ACJAS6_000559 [Rickettsiales bacterium]|jgi:hypothetical protein
MNTKSPKTNKDRSIELDKNNNSKIKISIKRGFFLILKTLIIIFVALFLVVASIFASFYWHIGDFFANSKERYFYSKLEETSKNNKEYILLKDATNFEWDYVCQIGPYGPSEEYEKKYYEKIVGFDFDGKVPSSSTQDDNLSFLFINKKLKNSAVIDADRLIDHIIIREVCSQKDQRLTLEKVSDKNTKPYRKGFYKLNHFFNLQPINN